MYAFVNADFISDAIPDSDINPSANYLFLQRDYKLGGCYNSVIFPVDVPLQNEHHIYNGGKNRLVVYKLESVDDNCLNFVKDPSGVLLANTPYIVMSDGTDNSTTSDILSEFYMTDAPVDSFDINCIKNITPGEVTEVYAQYKKAVVQKNDCIDPDTDIFILSNNKLINCRNIKTTTVKRFRWYIKRPRGAAPLMLSLDGTVTAVANAVSLDVVDGRVYDLWGRCCGYAAGSGLPKGLFVNGGRVVAGGPVH